MLKLTTRKEAEGSSREEHASTSGGMNSVLGAAQPVSEARATPHTKTEDRGSELTRPI
jgi:hypothetical protein